MVFDWVIYHRPKKGLFLSTFQSAKDILRSPRLFNDDILMLSVAGKIASVDITDYDLLCQYLDRVLDGFSENRYANDAVSLTSTMYIILTLKNILILIEFEMKYTIPKKMSRKLEMLFMQQDIIRN
jgi:hypothetical protein